MSIGNIRVHLIIGGAVVRAQYPDKGKPEPMVEWPYSERGVPRKGDDIYHGNSVYTVMQVMWGSPEEGVVVTVKPYQD